MKEMLEQYLQTRGFFKLTSKLSEVAVLVKFENNLANILQIIDYTNDSVCLLLLLFSAFQKEFLTQFLCRFR